MHISNLITRENITLAIALFGAIGTAINATLSLIHNRANLNIRIVKIKDYLPFFLTYVIFENNSRLPISVTSISIQIDGIFYPCSAIPEKVITNEVKRNGEILSYKETYSMTMPIEIGSLGAAAGYIYFDNLPELEQLLSKPLIFRVSTNRGKVFQIELSHPDRIPALM